MELLADPATLALAAIAVCILGLAKGGFSGLGVLGTPLLALALPPAVAAAILLPALLLALDLFHQSALWTFGGVDGPKFFAR